MVTGAGLQAGLLARPGTSGAKKNTFDGGPLSDREAGGFWAAHPSSREPASTAAVTSVSNRKAIAVLLPS